jgi:hypothetical protein
MWSGGVREWHGFASPISDLDNRISSQVSHLVQKFPCDFQSLCKSSIQIRQLHAVWIYLKLAPFRM